MKIRKSAERKNFIVNTSFYSELQLELLVDAGKITPEANVFCKGEYKVSSSNCKEIKVIFHEGSYCTVVILEDSTTVFVEL